MFIAIATIRTTSRDTPLLPQPLPARSSDIHHDVEKKLLVHEPRDIETYLQDHLLSGAELCPVYLRNAG